MPDSTDWITTLSFEDEASFDTEFGDDHEFNMSMDEAVVISIKDHRQLDYRDAPEQHPIESISALEGELAVRPSESLSNADIQSILDR